MSELLEHPRVSGKVPNDRIEQFLFYLNDTIVGWVNADCCVCAWRDGHLRWPIASMAVTLDGGTLTGEMCIVAANNKKRQYRANN